MNKTISVSLAAVFLTTASCLPAAFAANAQPPDRDKLVRELEAVRSDLTEAQKGVEEGNRELMQTKHDLEYQDPELRKLYEEIVALEKQLLEKRRQLQVREALNPEIKKLDAQRKALFRNLEALREQEAAIQRELSALDHTAPQQD